MASGKGNAFITELLAYLMQATEFSFDANTNLYVSLHTGAPGPAGNQATSEATYGAYARVAVARTSGGWTASGVSIHNAAAVTFPTCASGSNTITHVGIGTASSGAGELLYWGALGGTLSVSASIQPQFAAGALIVTES